MASTVNGAALAEMLGEKVVVRYDEGYFVNPDGTGTKAVSPQLEQAVIRALAFAPDFERFPQVGKSFSESGVPFDYQGF